MQNSAQVLLEFEKKNQISVLPLIVTEDIGNEEVHNTLRFFRTISEFDPVLIILHIPDGGASDECSRICHAITTHKGNVSIFVPEIATSTGAQIALMGDQLILGKNASLTPFDDQLDSIPAKEMIAVRKLLKSKEKKNSKNSKNNPLADMVSLTLEDYANVIESKRMLKITEKEITKVLKTKEYTKSTIDAVVKKFLHHNKYHAYPIYAKDLKKVGLKVKTQVPVEYWVLFDQLYENVNTKDEKSDSKEKKSAKLARLKK